MPAVNFISRADGAAFSPCFFVGAKEALAAAVGGKISRWSPLHSTAPPCRINIFYTILSTVSILESSKLFAGVVFYLLFINVLRGPIKLNSDGLSSVTDAATLNNAMMQWLLNV